MRLVSFGNLYLDYYFKNQVLVGVMGGKTNANILANLSSKYACLFIGACGLDDMGDIAIKSLNDLGVKTIIKRVDEHTKVLFLEGNSYTKKCPYCNRLVGYHGDKLELDDIKNNLLDSDYLIIDNLSDLSISVLENTSNKAFIDLGYDNDIITKSLDELVAIMKDRFLIINLNERVYDTIKNKFGIDSVDFYELMNPKLLIITKGKRGCEIIYNGEIYEKEILEPAKEIDPLGAGDSFYSVFIDEYLKDDNITEKFISSTFMKANIMARKCISNIGARSHLMPLYKITNYENCICEHISIN